MGPEPYKCEDMARVPDWAHHNWSLAAGGWTSKKSLLDPEGQPRYVNSGFIVGPVQKLSNFYQNVVSDVSDVLTHDVPGDQYFITKRLMKHPEEAVLDSANSLVTCGYSLDMRALF